MYKPHFPLKEYFFCLETSRAEVVLSVSQPIFDMAARGGPTSLRECVQSYVVDIQRRFERGNHDADSLDYIVFRIDWIINLLVRYSGIEGVDPRVIDLLRELKDSITASQCTNSQMTETIFTGVPGIFKKNSWNFLLNRVFVLLP